MAVTCHELLHRRQGSEDETSHLVVALLYLHPRPRSEIFTLQQLRPVVFVSSLHHLSEQCACQMHTVTFPAAVSILLCTATPLASFSPAATLSPARSASSVHTSSWLRRVPTSCFRIPCTQAGRQFASGALLTNHGPPSLATILWFFSFCLPQVATLFAEVYRVRLSVVFHLSVPLRSPSSANLQHCSGAFVPKGNPLANNEPEPPRYLTSLSELQLSPFASAFLLSTVNILMSSLASRSSVSASEILRSKIITSWTTHVWTSSRAPILNFCFRSVNQKSASLFFHPLNSLRSPVLILRSAFCLRHCEFLSSTFIAHIFHKGQDVDRFIPGADQEVLHFGDRNVRQAPSSHFLLFSSSALPHHYPSAQKSVAIVDRSSSTSTLFTSATFSHQTSKSFSERRNFL